MNLVAISQRTDFYPGRDEIRDGLDQRLCEWLVEAGYLCVPVPNGLGSNGLRVWLSSVGPAAIVLSGGNNIGESIERDNIERQMLAYAEEHTLPVLGVCRGMQMMGLWAGAKLIPVQGHTRTRHELSGELSGEVNSFHDYSLDVCPDGFKVTAMADDGCIEAIRHDYLPWEGWMWHPEREASFLPRDIKALQILFDA